MVVSCRFPCKLTVHGVYHTRSPHDLTNTQYEEKKKKERWKNKYGKTELNLLFSIEHNNFCVSRDAHSIILGLAAAMSRKKKKIETIGGDLADCVCVVDISLVDCRVQCSYSVFFSFNYCNRPSRT